MMSETAPHLMRRYYLRPGIPGLYLIETLYSCVSDLFPSRLAHYLHPKTGRAGLVDFALWRMSREDFGIAGFDYPWLSLSCAAAINQSRNCTAAALRGRSLLVIR